MQLDFDKAIKLIPSYIPNYLSEAYYNRGLNYYLICENNLGSISSPGNLANAITNFSKAIELNPNYSEAYNKRGLAYFTFGNPRLLKLAIEDYKKTIELNPNYAEVYFNLGNLFSAGFLKEKEYEQAIQCYDTAILINPNYIEAYNNRGVVYYELRKYQEAISDAEKAIEIDPNHETAYRLRGECYKKLGDYENARTYLTEANRIYPNLGSVLAELADCYSLCGEDKIGKVLFREAFFVSPDDVDMDFLDSEIIKCLVKITDEKGYSGKTAQYWIPVYGVLTGIFNVKKELSSQEVAKLKKDIYALENENKDPSCNRELLVPRLLNCYFWLLDYYALAKENNSKISEILLKIKILDSSIYESYIK